MNITTLNIEQVVNGILANHKDGIETAIEEDRQAGLTNKQSKAIANCVVEIRKEIQRMGAIYDREEKEAIRFITTKHSETKGAHKTCLDIVKGLQKNWDDRHVRVMRSLVDQMSTAVAEIKQLKQDLTGHQGFRNKFCNVNECTRLLGQRNYNELNKIYLGFREGPLKEYAALEDKIKKVSEHLKRGEQCLLMLPSLQKEFDVPNESLLAGLGEDAKRVREAWTTFTNANGNSANTLKTGTYDVLKAHKQRPVTAPMLKQMKTTIGQHEKKIKAAYSSLKTCMLIFKDAPKKAGDAAKTNEGKPLLKQIKTDVDQFKTAVDDWAAVYKKASDEWVKVDKALAKAGG